MILSDRNLSKLSQRGMFTSGLIGPASIDLTLSKSYSIPIATGVQYLDQIPEMEQISKSRFMLMPQQFVLASTEEVVNLTEHYAGFVTGRSSVGRLGLQIENAGFIDPGFEGQITLELVNQAPYPIMLEAGWRICQLVIFKLDEPAKFPYQGKYQHQSGATPSLLHTDKIQG